MAKSFSVVFNVNAIKPVLEHFKKLDQEPIGFGFSPEKSEIYMFTNDIIKTTCTHFSVTSNLMTSTGKNPYVRDFAQDTSESLQAWIEINNSLLESILKHSQVKFEVSVSGGKTSCFARCGTLRKKFNILVNKHVEEEHWSEPVEISTEIPFDQIPESAAEFDNRTGPFQSVDMRQRLEKFVDVVKKSNSRDIQEYIFRYFPKKHECGVFSTEVVDVDDGDYSPLINPSSSKSVEAACPMFSFSLKEITDRRFDIGEVHESCFKPDILFELLRYAASMEIGTHTLSGYEDWVLSYEITDDVMRSVTVLAPRVEEQKQDEWNDMLTRTKIKLGLIDEPVQEQALEPSTD